jgi:hypothetical protein
MTRLIAPAILIVAVWLGWQAAGGAYAQENPRLASLDIAVWPEFDRPAALVILRAEIAGDVGLPAAVSLRIPASSGGPAALAYAASADGQLLNLVYQRSDAQDFITLTFSTPEHFFQVEFYDPMAVAAVDRSYTYTWPGDLAADKLSVELQEPAAATGLSVKPELGPGEVRPDGLTYRQADLGAFGAGQTLAIGVRYQKTDSRTSTEILAAGTGSDEGAPVWLVVALLALVVLAVCAGGIALWRWRERQIVTPSGRAARAARRREKATGQRESGTNFCPQCGAALRARDRFCPECGAAVRRS